MTASNIEEIMTENYRQVFKQILSSLFKSDPKLRPEYMSEPIQRQREIDKEIEAKSAKMAKSLVSKLKARGFLESEPTDNELEALIRSTIEEFGTQL